ncbi:MAG: FHA domain-containing protein [Gammaproteobacteria bacterium]|nr:FHA domain-containing protein [Gammaproteobacteria bacterium]
MAWKIRIKEHKTGSISEQTLDQPVVHLGRDPNSDIVLDHGRISRRHLKLSDTDGHMYLEESSRNGTFVRIADHWVKIHGEIGLLPPFKFRVADWSVIVDRTPEPEPVEEDQMWDQSVIIPAGSLAQQQVAILVFDLCESSLIASQDDHMAYHLKNRLNQIGDPVLAEYQRKFFKSTGDGFLATFEDSNKALAAAIKLEERIQLRNERTSNAPIHYRIALHYGETWAIMSGGEEDIHGNDVNITFRIEGAQSSAFKDVQALFPKRDRILCSARFIETLDDDDPLVDRSREVPCGDATLKGITEPVSIVWLKTAFSVEDLDATLATQTLHGPR